MKKAPLLTMILSLFVFSCGEESNKDSDSATASNKTYCVPEKLSTTMCHESSGSCLTGTAGNNWKKQDQPCSTDNLKGKCTSILGVLYYYNAELAATAKPGCSGASGTWSDS